MLHIDKETWAALAFSAPFILAWALSILSALIGTFRGDDWDR